MFILLDKNREDIAFLRHSGRRLAFLLTSTAGLTAVLYILAHTDFLSSGAIAARLGTTSADLPVRPSFERLCMGYDLPSEWGRALT